MEFNILFVLLFQIFSVSEQKCSTDVCFTWKVRHDELVLACRVSQLKFWIKIEDPFHNIQADCIPPYPVEKCESHYKNGTIKQSKKTNMTIFKVHGKIDKMVNGNWTCHHGTGRETAFVEVTVLTISENISVPEVKTTQKSPYNADRIYIMGNSCLIDAFLKSISCFMFAVVCPYGYLLYLKKRIRIIKVYKNWLLFLVMVTFLTVLALLIYTFASSQCGYSWIAGVSCFVVGFVMTVSVMLKCVEYNQMSKDTV